MIKHIIKNKFWIITGAELITIAFMFSIGFSVIDIHVPASFQLVAHPSFRLLVIAIGVQSVWDITWYYIREVTRLAAAGVVGMMMSAFLLSDLNTLHITLVPLGLMFLLVRILIDLLTDNTLFKVRR
ncbi:hypothetical protein FKV75_03985 [Weissella paramesenteroides]|uniref:hypothetical protein n=1 Tax=Weissella paramesenteroides TaxID=1249 RepID=UPI00123A73D7|nr:hypothetical protein [Weissella paramesenteroides]KAA8440415.1 hypothetical protein FKV77_08020 [Weissella paramesenteroides]KAA8440994.1 hypothetical protein FKV81_04960 [Weissella paramesenteroides]KAA8443425.1 hypothetical protein FKV75_03985 [Weissella paramesenteroides]KAA8447714.1 hypothetical protein FKV76_04205 [Weissella paramesenteroides]KAA8449683.1 hypothetical protein FKV74_05710 [Weissella paramesenteroides]